MGRMTTAIVIAVGLTAGHAPAEQRTAILVTPDWLEEHLNDESLVVIQVADVRSDYQLGHIPGARFLWPGWVERSTAERGVELASIESLDATLENLGVSNSSRIVLCHTYTLGSAASVARAWVMLDYLGMGDRAMLLDGGFEGWNAAGKPVTKDNPAFENGDFTPTIDDGIFVDSDYVLDNLDKPGVRLVDTRRPADFRGGARGVLRTGHIRGAVNLPHSKVIDEARCYAPLDTLRARFTAAGIAPDDELIAYCYRGKAACMFMVAATMLGHKVHIYDGSFEDWSGREELPLELSKAEE